jgi:hypothetical protein
MKNIYYHVGSVDEIQVILRNGFIDITTRINGLLKRGVYIADAPGEPDPGFLDDQLLEITLSSEIDLRKWRVVLTLPGKNPCSWAEWIVPANVLNNHAKLRLLTS